MTGLTDSIRAWSKASASGPIPTFALRVRGRRASERQIRSTSAWLSLAATPTFAVMAVLEAAHGGGRADMMCSAGGGSLLSGMITMYALMSAFHLGPWLRLLSR